MSGRRVAIVGFGFSGLMVASNLVRDARAPLTLYLIAPTLEGLGVAYGTRNAAHLLNVPANKMGAFADDSMGFWQWLSSGEGALAKQRLGIRTEYRETSFVPRLLYGAYLQAIWRQTQHVAQQKNIVLNHVPSIATALQHKPFAVLTERGDAIAVDDIVLATGNENKPLPMPPEAPMIQDPWAAHALDDAATWPSPVLLIGTGLTAVDMVLTLRARGYAGEIIAASLRGIWPKPHTAVSSVFGCDEAALHTQKNLRSLLAFVRRSIAQHEQAGGDWRAVIDALRPHTQAMWLRASSEDKRRFFRHLMTYWSTHRHRMAPEVCATIAGEIAAGTLRSIARSKLSEVVAHHAPSRILNCTGPQLNMGRSAYTLWKQAVAERWVEVHETGIGIAVDAQCRAWGEAYPNLYAIGTAMTGQWLESTAVPELRQQAAMVAAAINAV